MSLAQDRDHWRALVTTAMNLSVPQKVVNFLARCLCLLASLKEDSGPWSYLVA
jgi:hypothetical protein